MRLFVAIDVTAEQAAALERLMESEDCSFRELVRRALNEYAADEGLTITAPKRQARNWRRRLYP